MLSAAYLPPVTVRETEFLLSRRESIFFSLGKISIAIEFSFPIFPVGKSRLFIEISFPEGKENVDNFRGNGSKLIEIFPSVSEGRTGKLIEIFRSLFVDGTIFNCQFFAFFYSASDRFFGHAHIFRHRRNSHFTVNSASLIRGV